MLQAYAYSANWSGAGYKLLQTWVSSGLALQDTSLLCWQAMMPAS